MSNSGTYELGFEPFGIVSESTPILVEVDLEYTKFARTQLSFSLGIKHELEYDMHVRYGITSKYLSRTVEGLAAGAPLFVGAISDRYKDN